MTDLFLGRNLELWTIEELSKLISEFAEAQKSKR